MTYRPLELAQALGISSSTLRLWSNQFASLLSDLARKQSAGAPTAQRRYTEGDLDILTQAKELLTQGLTYEETRRRLARHRPASQTSVATLSHEHEASTSPLQIDPFTSLREAIEAKDNTIAALKESLAFMDVYLRTVLQEREDAIARERLLKQQLERQDPGDHSRLRPWWKRLLAIP